MELASFWRRLGAQVVDWIIFFAIAFVLGSILGIGVTAASAVDVNPLALIGAMLVGQLVILIIMFVVDVIYGAYFESSEHQGTIGKILLGIKVVDESGNRLDFQKAAIRNVIKYVPVLGGILLFIGGLLVAFTKEKKAFHDLLVKTQVVRK